MYEPVTQQKAKDALLFAMSELQEQIDDDETIMQGRYLFRVQRCEAQRSAAQE